MWLLIFQPIYPLLEACLLPLDHAALLEDLSLQLAIVGPIIGYLVGLLAVNIVEFVYNDVLIETTMTILAAYTSFCHTVEEAAARQCTSDPGALLDFVLALLGGPFLFLVGRQARPLLAGCRPALEGRAR